MQIVKDKRVRILKKFWNNIASSLFYLSFRLFYYISLCYISILSIVSVARAYISACSIPILCVYNLSIWLYYCTLIANMLSLILLATRCCYSSILIWSSSPICLFLEAQVHSSLYHCYCCLLFLPMFLGLSSLYLLLPLFSLLSSNLYFFL